MIDTDKYEGYNDDAPWRVNAGHDYIDIDAGSIRIASVEHASNAQLIADAPLFLAEVKRFRRIAKNCLEAIEAGGGIRSGTIELIEENLKGMIE